MNFPTGGFGGSRRPTPTEILDKIKQVDGSGSGLDADLLDGKNSATAATGDTVAVRDAGGELAVATATAASSAVPLAQVEGLLEGLSSKGPVDAVADADVVTLSGTTTIDGIALIAGDIVLLTAQLTASENGPWVIAAGAWTRPDNFAAGSAASMSIWLCDRGTLYADTRWWCTTDKGSDVVDTDPLTIVRFSGAAEIIAGAGLIKTGNTIGIDPDADITVNSVQGALAITARNSSGALIAAGKVVYVSGAITQKPTIALADNTVIGKYDFIGILPAAIANNTDGLVFTDGLIKDIDTSAFNDGDILYLSTSGNMTNTMPTTGSIQRIGVVAYAHPSLGKIVFSRSESATMAAANGENLIFRLGDAAGANKASIRDNTNAEVASLDSLGNHVGRMFTGVSKKVGTATGVKFCASYENVFAHLLEDGLDGDGAIKITLPKSWSNTTLHLEFDIYDYETSKSITIICGGYLNISGSQWLKTFAHTFNDEAISDWLPQVRFGHDGSKAVIVLGDETLTNNLDSTNIKLSSLLAGFENVGGWESGWVISAITSTTGITFSGTSFDFSTPLYRGVIKKDGTSSGTQFAASYDSIFTHLLQDVPDGDGAIKVTLPKSWSNTTLHLTFNFYNYATGSSTTIICGGYTSSVASAWQSVFAYSVNDVAIQSWLPTVRFGHDGSNCVIVFGDETLTNNLDSTNISLTSVLAGFSNVDGWESGWAAAAITATTGITFSASTFCIGRRCNHGGAYVSSAAATNSITAGTPRNLFENATIATTTNSGTNFTIDNTLKRAKYTGEISRIFDITAAISMTSGASNIVAKFWIYKNGVQIAESEQQRKIGTGSDVGNLSVISDVELAKNDYIEIFVDISSGTSTITAEKANVQIREN